MSRILAFAFFLLFSHNLAAEIKIGVAASHTGLYSAFGEQLWRGVSLAIQQINQDGGINGEQLVAVQADDQCEESLAPKVAEVLINQEEVDLVIGHVCSATSIAGSEIYRQANLLMITPASTNPRVTDRQLPNVLRVAGRDDDQGRVASSYMVNRLMAKRIVIVHDRDLYGKGLADATRASLKDEKVVFYTSLARGQEDYSLLVDEILLKQPDLVYFGGLHNEAGILLRQLRGRDFNGWFVSGAGIASHNFVDKVREPRYLSRTLMTFGADPRDAEINPAGIEAVARFRQQGFEPEGYTLYAYAATQLAAEAIRQTGITEGAFLADWLKNNRVATVMGEIAFDNKGDLIDSVYTMYRWHPDGSYSRLRAFP